MRVVCYHLDFGEINDDDCLVKHFRKISSTQLNADEQFFICFITFCNVFTDSQFLNVYCLLQPKPINKQQYQ